MRKHKVRLRYIKHQRYIYRKVLKLRRRNKCIIKRTKIHLNPYTSKILTNLKESNFVIEGLNFDSYVEFDVPEQFCFSNNPVESAYFLRRLYSAFQNLTVREIHFSHLNCKNIGVCASTIMDVIVLECIKWRKSIRKPINVSGDLVGDKVSLTQEVDQLVKSSGLLKHLNIYDTPIKNTETLELINNGNSAEASEKSIDYINKSLKRHGVILTKEGENLFSTFFGEIIDNCVEHGGSNVEWFTLGHYSYDNTNKLGRCKLCIVDFGETIYESLKYHSSTEMQRKLKRYSKKSLLSQKSISNEEILYTVFSLQQRVSRVIEKDVVRGNGTVEYIEAFLSLFNSSNTNYKSVFSITSGRTSILFDGRYTTAIKEDDAGLKNKIITFNDSNNLYDAPDPAYVKNIKHNFPGTIISMDLYLDSKYLKRSN